MPDFYSCQTRTPDWSQIRGPSEKFVDWRHCAVIMQREAVTYSKL